MGSPTSSSRCGLGYRYGSLRKRARQTGRVSPTDSILTDQPLTHLDRFRSVKYRGHVLRLPSNGKADKPFVYLKQEATKNNAGQHQWVLQKHPEKLPELPD